MRKVRWSSAGALETETLQPGPQQVVVLLAEDDPDMRQLLGDTLRDDGYLVREAADGVELVDFLARKTTGGQGELPDLVVSDIRMPGHTGMEVLTSLRQEFWALPVILITAFGDPETHNEARRLGAAAVLDKPFSIRDFRHTVALHAPIHRETDAAAS